MRFFKSAGGRFNLLTTASFFVDVILRLVDIKILPIFRAVSALRPLRLLHVTPGISVRSQ
jgi:hypothetical protein